MIRISRGRTPEQEPETPNFQESYTTDPNLMNNARQEMPPVTAPGRGAMSESESLARDIKDGRLSGFVGAGTILTGETTFHAMLRIDGRLTGRVTSENGTLIIGSTGRVDANILVAVAAVNGTVNGDIVALEKVQLGRNARVVGNIQTPRLVVEDGAIFEGGCTMLKVKEVLEKRIAETKMQTAANKVSAEEEIDATTEEVSDEAVG